MWLFDGSTIWNSMDNAAHHYNVAESLEMMFLCDRSNQKAVILQP